MVTSLHFILCATLVVVGAGATLRQGAQLAKKPSAEGYSFAQFTRDFARNYAAGSKEYISRAALFEASLIQIHAKNAKNQREGRAWRSGVHPFMDWTVAERTSLKGYKPNRGRRSGPRIAALQVSSRSRLQSNMSSSARSFGSDSADGGQGITVRNQGTCGSCWAISAVEAIEARLPANTQVSAQALVDCVPNPKHCGGTGGCDGATGELAYEYARDHGLPLESSYSYTGRGKGCQADTAYPTNQRVRISGWTNLESNKAQPLMDALYNSGPVVVAVAADDWFDYDQGVFDGCKKDAVLDHAVLAKGYGGEGNGMWWRIQNSWGGNWGEQGHIRLKRRDTASEDSYCGQDTKPQDGLGCDGGPAAVTVCGTCGVLFDPLYPEGVTLEGAGTDSSSFSSQSPAFTVYQPDPFKDDKDTAVPDVVKPQVAAAVAQPDYLDYFKVAAVPEVVQPQVAAAVAQPDYLDYFKVAAVPEVVKPQVAAAVAQPDYLDYFKDDKVATVPDVVKPQVAAAVAQPGYPDLFADDAVKPQVEAAVVSQPVSSAGEEASIDFAFFHPAGPPEVVKSDSPKNGVDRMRALFRQNFLQAQ